MMETADLVIFTEKKSSMENFILCAVGFPNENS